MAKASVVTKQTDFSAGEVDPALKRADDDPLFKAGGRQMSNWRILNSRSLTNRPGRRALFLNFARVDEIVTPDGTTWYLAFSNASVKVLTAAGAVAGSSSALWTAAQVNQVVWTQAIIGLSLDIVMCFTGMQPLIARYIGGAWSFLNYDFGPTSAGGRNSPFYRLAPRNITLQPNAINGSIFLNTSANYFTPQMIGSHVVRWINVQIAISNYINPTTAIGITIGNLPSTNSLVLTNLVGKFNVGDVITEFQSTYQAEVTAVAGLLLNVNMFAVGARFAVNNTIIGPTATAQITAVGAAPPDPSTIWDEAAVGAYNGWPASCFYDQSRLGFCNLPALPGGIIYSSVGRYDAFLPGGLPNDPIFEIVPNRSRVLYVVPGPESSEFVFCDKALYYIPISQTNPLKPGSVSFQLLTGDGCGAVQPRIAQETIVYVNAGLSRVLAVAATGAYQRPFEVRDLSLLHIHLFNSIVAIAAPNADTTFPERYVYVLNGDGTIVIGKYTIASGQIQGTPGWLPWSGTGTVKWVSARAGNTLFCTSYPLATGIVTEILDEAKYLDASMLYNSVPTALTPPGGKGPLWWMAGGTVDLMDGPLGTRMMGTYTVDANGFLIPQNNAGENFTSVNLVVGQAWTATLEPFIPAVQAGQDMAQRMWPRRLKRVQVYVQNSTGFLMARLFAGPVTRTSPAIGTVMARRRIPAWNIDDDPTQPPPLREQSYLDRPTGLAHDPRWAFIKDTPGPQMVLELDIEVTV